MEFKNRLDAAEKLLTLIKKEELIGDVILISLLRGGTIIGDYLATKLKVKHFPLVSIKISAPFNQELAIGAICFDVTHIEEKIIKMLNLSNSQITKQVKEAEKKFINYCMRFNVEVKKFDILSGKTVIITDDGVATGSTLLAAVDFIKTKVPQKIIIALPVAPTNFEVEGVYKSIIIHKDPTFTAISQYYRNFPQVEDNEINALKSINNKLT